jgi:hypothetical protein
VRAGVCQAAGRREHFGGGSYIGSATPSECKVDVDIRRHFYASPGAESRW